MRLHAWAFDDPSVVEKLVGDLVGRTGAVIMGRRSYDDSIEAWGGKAPFGDDVPCFVSCLVAGDRCWASCRNVWSWSRRACPRDGVTHLAYRVVR